MAISFDKVKAGDTLYDVRRQKGRVCTWSVYVVSIDATTNTTQIKWNGNPAKTYRRVDVERLRKSRPEDKS